VAVKVIVPSLLAAQAGGRNEFDVEGATLVVFDTCSVDFVDSSGLSAIIAAATALEDRGGLFLIEGMSPAMQRVLEVTGLLERYRWVGESDNSS
jgi:anti-anti-sigma factor